jgi:formate dehydrogenase major subunit
VGFIQLLVEYAQVRGFLPEGHVRRRGEEGKRLGLPLHVQLVPEPFVEIPVELAEEIGIKGGEKVKVTSARSYYIAKAFVTRRIKPMTIDSKKVYQIGIPIHQGYRGIQEDEGKNAKTVVNRLTPTVVDPNAYTPEFKGFLVKIEKA